MPSGKPALTGQELEIMKVVWSLQSATVRQDGRLESAVRDRPPGLRNSAQEAPHRLYHRHDDDEHPGAERFPHKKPGRPRLYLQPGTAAEAGGRVPGAGFPESRL